MTKNRLVRQSICMLGALSLLFCTVHAENIDPDDVGSQYAYGENIGWIDLEAEAAAPGVEVTDEALTGYMWGENIGWISLNPSTTGGVVNDGQGNLSGSAWGENVGWINFAPDTGGVTIDPETGEFDGCAWGENVGWICFKSTGSVNYGVVTSWRAASTDTGGDTGTDDDGNTGTDGDGDLDSGTNASSNNGGGCFVSSATDEIPAPAATCAFLLLTALLPLMLLNRKKNTIACRSTDPEE